MGNIIQASAKSAAAKFAIGLAIVVGFALLALAAQGAQAQEEGGILAASSTSFSSTGAVLASNGNFVDLTVNATGVPLGVSGVQVNIQHPSAFTVTSGACAGILTGGFVFPSSTTGGTLIGCNLLSGTVSSADGAVISFRLTRVADFSGPQMISFGQGDPCVDEFSTYYTEVASGPEECLDFPGEIRHQPGTVNTLTVNGAPNNAPVAIDDSYSVDEDGTLTEALPGVLSNDTDADSDPLTAALVGNVSNGVLTLNPDGSFTYTPNADFNGSDSFTYKANDSVDDSNTATVTITVNAVNDAPVANNDNYSVNEDGTLTEALPGVLSNDTDADSDPLTAALVGNVSNGVLTLNPDGSFTYTPNADFNGSDSFTYKANDSIDDSNTATVTLTVNAVNDAPVAVNDSYTTAEDTPLTIGAPGVLANDTDVEGGALTAILVSDVINGSLTLDASGSFTYTPDLSFNGDDTFTYKASDGAADSNTATVTISVGPVNDAPTAANNSYSTNEDALLEVAAPGVLGNDSDPEGDTITAALVSDVSHGSLALSLDGSFTYMPDANFNGSDTFTYKASDGSLDSDPATVTITVIPVNDAPTAGNENYSVQQDSVLSVPAPGVLTNDTDVDGNPLTAILNAAPEHGALTLHATGSFTYTPDSGYVGSDSFEYHASDGSASSNIATVSITVTAAPLGNVDVDFTVALQIETGSGMEAFTIEGWQGGVKQFTRDATAAAVAGVNYTLALTDIPQGTFTIHIAADRHNGFSDTLPNIVPGVGINAGGATPSNLGVLREGDVVPNADWVINALDLSLLLGSLDPAMFPAGNPALYSSWVDLNQDGAVDGADYALLVSNYRCHASSAGTVCP